MITPLLRTKLHRPDLRPQTVPRPHLIDRLNAGLARGHPLTLVTAPAGFGKTTLVVGWLNQLSRPAAWVSLDEGDNDPVRFFRYLIAALQQLSASVGRGLLQEPNLPSIEALCTPLINDLLDLPEPILLVLDDYHLIHHEYIHQALSFLLLHPPVTLHLVLTGRADPPLPLSRLRVREQVSELRQAELRFTPAETAQFFTNSVGLELSTAAVMTLAERTEGWVAGLQLAGLSLQDHSPDQVDAFITAFSGSHHYVIDYLIDEVMRRQPDDLRQFLCQTAILPRFNAALCEAVTGCSDGAALLTRLERANLFLLPLDEDRIWYRYQHLFADFLRTEMGPHESEELHRRAARWFAANELLPEAIDHAFKAGDVGYATALIARAADTALQQGEMTTLLTWLDRLPEQTVRRDPVLATVGGWALWLLGDGDRAQRYAEAATDVPPPSPDSVLAGKLLGLQACLAGTRQLDDHSLALAAQALARLPETESFYRGLVLLIRSEMEKHSGRTTQSIDTLQEMVRTGEQAAQPFMAIGALVNLAQLLNLQGRRQAALQICAAGIEQHITAVERPLPIAGLLLITQAELFYEANDLATAAAVLRQGMTLGRNQSWLGFVASVNMALIPLKYAQGDREAAEALIHKTARLLEQAGFDPYLPLLAAMGANLQLRTGNLQVGERWAHQAGLSPTDYPQPFSEPIYLVYARLLLYLERPDQARPVLDRLAQATEAGGRLRLWIEVAVLQALALAAQGEANAASRWLQRALQRAAPEGYRRLFLDEMPALAPLLPPATDAAPDLVAALLAESVAETGPVNQTALIEPLSERELEVLRLVAAGHSNRAVAAQLVVTVGTVKKHLHNIFTKLGVSSRTQALARARTLKLL